MVASEGTMGARLRILRERQGLTQKEIAERLGLSEAGYRHYESGRARLSADQIPALAQALGVEVYDILVALGLADRPPGGQPLPAFRDYIQAKYAEEIDEDLIAMIEGLIERKREREAARRRRAEGERGGGTAGPTN